MNGAPASCARAWLADLGLGAAPLAAAEAAALDERGFVVLEGLLAPAALEGLRAAFEAAVAGDPATATGRGTRHSPAHLGRDERFDALLGHPRALGAVAHVLGRPFRAQTLGARDPQPGFGGQALHADALPRARGEGWSVATCLWLLDDFTPENGATRVVPGSHRDPRPVPSDRWGVDRRHPEEVLVTAGAGSVLVLNGHLWHAGTTNRSSSPRRVVQCVWIARELVRADLVPDDLPARLPAPLRALLGA